MADEILTRYKIDFGDLDARLTLIETNFKTLENQGKKTMSGVSDAANKATADLNKTGQSAATVTRQFNGLNNSINQISRELPAFAVNANTGFLAISNNLPILIDEINRLKAANVQLAASGQPVQSVFKQIIASVFSLQTALSVAITLLTVFGGKIIDWVTGADKSAEAMERQNEELARQNLSLERNIKLRTLQNDTLPDNSIEDKRNKDLQKIEDKFNQDREARKQDYTKRLYELEKRTGIDRVLLIGEANADYVKLEKYNNDLSLALEEKYNFDKKNIIERYDKEEREARDKKIKEDNEAFQGFLDFQQKLFQLQEKGIVENAKKNADEYNKERKLQFDKYWYGLPEDATEAEVEASKSIYDQMEKDGQEQIKAKNEVDSVLIAGTIKRTQSEIEAEKKAKEAKVKIAQEYVNVVASLLNSLSNITRINAQNDIARSRRNDELQKRQVDRQYNELNKKNENFYAKQGQTESEYQAQKEQLQREHDERLAEIDAQGKERERQANQRAARQERDLAIFLGTVKVSLAIIEAFINPLKIPGAILAGAELAALVATPVPQFAKGVVDLQGPGTETSDSILARLSKGESVVHAKATRAHRSEIEAMNSGALDYASLIEMKYIKPAIEKERMRNNEFAENVARSLALHSAMSDKGIIKAIKDNKPATGKDIASLATSIDRSTRQRSFKSKMYQPR